MLCIQIELSHEVVAMAVHGAGAEHQPVGDFPVGVSVGDQPQDLLFARREEAGLGIVVGRLR